jgi:tRNA (guanine6-N2)-methyltransferase
MSETKRERSGRSYLAHVVPGLELIAVAEMRANLAGFRETDQIRAVDERTSLLLFTTSSAPGELLQLRTVEDVFVLALDTAGIPASRVGLAAIRSTVAHASALPPGATAALQQRPRRKGKTTFRVIARKVAEHAYRRVDVQRATELGIQDRFAAWRLVEDDAQLEFWVQLVRDRLLLAVRLSDSDMRQRTYRRASLPAALTPTVAAAMVVLSQPQEDDVFLDPMCGSGTILIERALAGRYRMLLGGDVAPDAVAATRENIGPRYKPIEIQQWDARALPLEDGTVSKIVTNLPFGKQIGSAEDNRTLYPALIAEWSRVLKPGGRMVLLTSERALLRRVLQRYPHFIMERQEPVLVRGMQAAIHLLRMQ